jgi:CBS domain-containing protein
MATNPEWRQPLHVWQRSFESWIEHPDEESLLRAAIMFDFRQVYGELKAEVALRQIVERSSKQHVFLARLGRTALRQSPPLTFFRNFAVERSGDQRDLIDVKTRGTALIVDLARVYALEAGSSETNTLARLRAATTQSSLSPTTAEELSAAFDLISLLRLRHQYRMLREGKKPSNLVPVSSLSRLEQRDLKDAFRAISTSQRGLEQTFQISLFG